VGFLPPNENAFMLPATPDRFQRDGRGGRRSNQLSRKMQAGQTDKRKEDNAGASLASVAAGYHGDSGVCRSSHNNNFDICSS
jgi:hypothetical protein